MTVQIAVTLPEELVARLDELVRSRRFPSRSAGVRRALEELLGATEGRQDDGAELAEATRLAVEAIEEEPWERWW